jgi:hypothetical protein
MVSYREQKIAMRRVLFLAFALVMTLNHAAYGADSSTTSSAPPERPTKTSP